MPVDATFLPKLKLPKLCEQYKAEMPRVFKTTNEDDCFVSCDIKQSAHWPI